VGVVDHYEIWVLALAARRFILEIPMENLHIFTEPTASFNRKSWRIIRKSVLNRVPEKWSQICPSTVGS
jgi:hypothetical protein